jgi:hypothetical protein
VVGSTVAPWEIAERSVGARGTVMELAGARLLDFQLAHPLFGPPCM